MVKLFEYANHKYNNNKSNNRTHDVIKYLVNIKHWEVYIRMYKNRDRG